MLRELNLVRDECTEPVVRENLELQERLLASDQTRAQLEDKLALTRSEVSKLHRCYLQILLVDFTYRFYSSKQTTRKQTTQTLLTKFTYGFNHTDFCNLASDQTETHFED